MIIPGADSEIICGTCGKPGVIRQLKFISEDKKYERYVTYETHYPDISSEAHMQAMQRLDRFMEQALKLYDGMIPVFDAIKLDKGYVKLVDINTHRPTACNVRVDVSLSFEVGLSGARRGFQLGPFDLKSVNAKTLQPEVTSSAEILIAELAAGRF